MKVLVVGGSGFIGSHLTRRLLGLGYEVYNVALKDSAETTTYLADVADYAILEKVFARVKPKYIFNLAVCGFDDSELHPETSVSTNALGTLNVLKLSQKYNVIKVVHSSTGTIFGKPRHLPIDETHPKNPISVYGVTKLCAEHFCQLMMQRGLNVTILRYSNVVGEGKSFGVIHKFKDRTKQNLPLIIYGGKQSNDYIYVDDVIDVNIICLEAGHNEDFNIGTGKDVTVIRLAEKIRNMLKGKNEIVIKPSRPHDPTWRFYFNIEKANAALKWSPKFNFQQVMERLVK